MLRFAFDLTRWGLAMLAGPIVWWIFPRDMEAQLPKGKGKYKWEWADRIWGNEVDGLSGDKIYNLQRVPKWLPKSLAPFWWANVRNPANNLARHIGPKGIITRTEHKKDIWWFYFTRGKTFYYSHVIEVFGKAGLFEMGYKTWPWHYGVGMRANPAIIISINWNIRGKGRKKA